jgi:hypothetical protein
MKIRLALPWVVLLAGLMSIGVGIFYLAPPQPRWRLPGEAQIDLALANEGQLLTWQSHGRFAGPIILRDLYSGEPIRLLLGVFEARWPVLRSPHGKWIAVSEPGGLRIAAVADGREHSIPCDPDEELEPLAFAACETLCVVAVKSRARIPVTRAWDLHTRRWKFQIDEPIAIDALSLDGKFMLSHSHEPSTGAVPWTVWTVYDIEDGVLRCRGPEQSRVDSHCFSRDGRRLVVQHGKASARHVECWDLETNKRLCYMFGDRLLSSSLSPDGRHVAVQTISRGDDPVITVAVLIADGGERVWEQSTAASMFWAEPAPEFAADGSSVIVYRTTPYRAEFYDTESGAHLETLVLEDRTGGWFDASLTVTPDRRVHAIEQQFTFMETAWWQKYVPDWILSRDNIREFVAIDVEARQVRGRIRIAENTRTHLVDGGRLLLTITPDPAGSLGEVCCWDIPPRPSWHCVIGVPAGLGALVVGCRLIYLRHRRPHAPREDAPSSGA